jgi:Coenzyme PQQ synthesis protein D (PqqD)
VDATRLQIKSDVVHETVDGEVILIDLANGSYYSLAGCGAAVWEALATGATGGEICAALEARFEAEPDAIEGAVAELLAQLRGFELIVEASVGSSTALPPPAAEVDRAAFVAPVIERYTDMKDYFLLDPIHEVSAEGWPKPAG